MLKTFHLLGLKLLNIAVLKYRKGFSHDTIHDKFNFLPKKKLQKPDVIIVSSLSPLPIVSAYFWSKKYKAKLLFEVRDIWPLSLIEIGGFSKLNPLVLFFWMV